MASIRITRWAGRHEVSQSRKVSGPLTWVAVPVRQGRGYCKLVGQCGAKGLGVWVALLELAAARDVDSRGVIEGTPEDVAVLARLPMEDVGSVLPVLSQIGWIEVGEDLESPNASPAPSAVVAEREPSSSAVSLQDGTDGRNGRTDGPDTKTAGASLPSGSGSALPENHCRRCRRETPGMDASRLCWTCSLATAGEYKDGDPR